MPGEKIRLGKTALWGDLMEANFLKLDFSKIKAGVWLEFEMACGRSHSVYRRVGKSLGGRSRYFRSNGSADPEIYDQRRIKNMFEHKTEQQAREEILNIVKEYCETYHNQKKAFKEGDRISYASRVYDSAEMVNLIDSSLEFWLTSGRYTAEFEKKLGEYLGVRYCSLVNSGSSANLNAFMALTSPLLGDRRIKRGDEVITVAAGFPTTVTPMIHMVRFRFL